MKFNIVEFLTNPFVPMFLATVTGLLLGKIKIGKFSFGQSGGLFTGIFIGWALYSKYAVPFIDPNDPKHGPLKNAPSYAINYIKSGVISDQFFTFTLILFIAAVGLLAAKDLSNTIKKNGLKFIILSVVLNGVGAIAIYLATKILPGQNKFAVSGAYTGALTSSPGLAAALEAVAKFGKEAQAQVGLGHTIAYAPGVLMVILVMNFFPVIFKIDIEKEKQRYALEMNSMNEKEIAATKENTIKTVGIDVIAFLMVCLVGYFVGSINIYIPFLKWINLGAAGGVLVISLVFGHFGKIGPLTFRMDNKILSAIRDISLSLFLAIVGLTYGYATVSSIVGSGAALAAISFVIGIISMLSGFLLGRYVFKMDWITLSGALCGAGTSTPGLGAAIDATGSAEVAASYGASYPIGLLLRVIFVIILHQFV